MSKKRCPQTIGKGGRRIFVYPVEINGFHTRVRTAIAVVLITSLFLAPWLEFGSSPFLRLSFHKDHFYILGQPILIYEIYHFVLLLALLGITLFAVSALWGRLWCGYACPQTVFIEHVMRRIEYWTEGPALRRKNQAGRPLTFRQLGKKILKHFLFLVVTFSFSFQLVALFTGPWELLRGEVSSGLFMVGLIGLIAYFDGAYFREQFCTLLCPYARFQSVLQDEETLAIGYDKTRGEPRGRRRVSYPLLGPDLAGDCIDCGLCMRVCPTAIDIRDGMNQLECLSCMRCADACNKVMTTLGRSKGLIRMAKERDLACRGSAQTTKEKRKWRPRVIIYVFLWIAVASLGLYKFMQREPISVRVVNFSGMPYLLEGTSVKNMFSLKIANQTRVSRSFHIRIKEQKDLFTLHTPDKTPSVHPGGELTFPVLVSAVQASNPPSQIFLEIISQEGEIAKEVSRPFITPTRHSPAHNNRK